MIHTTIDQHATKNVYTEKPVQKFPSTDPRHINCTHKITRDYIKGISSTPLQ